MPGSYFRAWSTSFALIVVRRPSWQKSFALKIEETQRPDKHTTEQWYMTHPCKDYVPGCEV